MEDKRKKVLPKTWSAVLKRKPGLSFRCSFCAFTTMSAQENRIHHHGHVSKVKKKFPCSICNFSCNSQKEIDQHKISGHPLLLDEKLLNSLKDLQVECLANKVSHHLTIGIPLYVPPPLTFEVLAPFVGPESDEDESTIAEQFVGPLTILEHHTQEVRRQRMHFQDATCILQEAFVSWNEAQLQNPTMSEEEKKKKRREVHASLRTMFESSNAFLKSIRAKMLCELKIKQDLVLAIVCTC